LVSLALVDIGPSSHKLIFEKSRTPAPTHFCYVLQIQDLQRSVVYVLQMQDLAKIVGFKTEIQAGPKNKKPAPTSRG
jgi:hypothetical protein